MTGRGGVVLAYIALSVAVTVLTAVGRDDIAVTVAVPSFGLLQALQHREVQKVQETVGPANGENLRDLMSRLIEHDSYSHVRNHDILNALTPSNAALAVDLLAIKHRCDRILDALKHPTGGDK